jgi:anaerobic selenocysteine-containing dehydrogenase
VPSYLPVPEHEKLGDDELILTTFKVNVQTHSRTQGCKYLSEIYHDNPAWINSQTARKLNINDGDKIKVRSSIGELLTTAHVSEETVPGVVAISFHCGHWQWGRFATAGQESNPLSDTKSDALDPDTRRIWWTTKGVHPNFIIPNAGDPIGGGQRWMDTVVKVSKV